MGVLCWPLFWYSLLCVLSSFAIILKRKRELFALLLLSFRCLVTVNVLWLFLMVPLVGLQCVIVVFPDHSHLLFAKGHCRLKHCVNKYSTLKLFSEFLLILHIHIIRRI